MLTTTISDFRKDIKKYFDTVENDYETLIINRGSNSGVVIVSLNEYNSLKATQYELSTRANEQRLDAAIAKLNSGKGMVKDLIQE